MPVSCGYSKKLVGILLVHTLEQITDPQLRGADCKSAPVGQTTSNQGITGRINCITLQEVLRYKKLCEFIALYNLFFPFPGKPVNLVFIIV